jgi:RHS repeat-associated protein
MTDGAGSVSYTYDNLDRPTSVARGADTFNYAYNASSNVTSRTLLGGPVTTYGYDAVGEMTSASTGGDTTTYTYDVAGHLLTTTLPNGFGETRTYDDAGRLTNLKNATPSTTLSEFAVALDGVGNPTQIIRSGATPSTTSYGYDASDRLTSVCYQASCSNSGDPYINWTYDKVGNRLTETRPGGTTNYTYNAADELTQAGATSHTYDSNGNELTAGQSSYTYDLANRMISSSDGTTMTSYSYDGNGNRVHASSAGATMSYLWDEMSAGGIPQLAVERDGSGTAVRSYTYGLGRISMIAAGATFYYHYDDHGSVANLTSSTGAAQWTYAYDPFGATRIATQNDPSAPANPMQFVGEYKDPNGLYNLRARQYDPTSGRMLAVDPLAQSAGDPASSPYLYASDRPGVLFDPTGQRAATCKDDPDYCDTPAPIVSPTPQPPPAPSPTNTPPITNYPPSGSPSAGPSAGGGSSPASLPPDGGPAPCSASCQAYIKHIIDFLEKLGVPNENIDRLEFDPARGEGIIVREQGTVGPQNTIRIMRQTYRYPNGYIRYTDNAGGYINPRTGEVPEGGGRSDPETHIDLTKYKGPFKNLPFTKGWKGWKYP